MDRSAILTSRRVLLVDDHVVVRAGFRRLLEEAGLYLEVHEAGSGREAYRLSTCHTFTLVVLDISLPDISGLETLRRLQRRHPQLRTLVMSMYDQAAFVEQALAAGASGYITKASAAEVLVDAVKQVLTGGRYLSADVANTAAALDAAERRLQRLSPREFEIFRMLAAGERVWGIAQRLCISYKTAANYSTIVRRKLSVGSASDLTRLAIRAGVVEL